MWWFISVLNPPDVSKGTAWKSMPVDVSWDDGHVVSILSGDRKSCLELGWWSNCLGTKMDQNTGRQKLKLSELKHLKQTCFSDAAKYEEQALVLYLCLYVCCSSYLGSLPSPNEVASLALLFWAFSLLALSSCLFPWLSCLATATMGQFGLWRCEPI